MTNNIDPDRRLNRTSYIRKMPCSGEERDSSGPDSMFVVDLFENGRKIETRSLPGKSRSYAVDLAENWETGVLQLLTE